MAAFGDFDVYPDNDGDNDRGGGVGAGFDRAGGADGGAGRAVADGADGVCEHCEDAPCLATSLELHNACWHAVAERKMDEWRASRHVLRPPGVDDFPLLPPFVLRNAAYYYYSKVVKGNVAYTRVPACVTKHIREVLFPDDEHFEEKDKVDYYMWPWASKRKLGGTKGTRDEHGIPQKVRVDMEKKMTPDAIRTHISERKAHYDELYGNLRVAHE
jgi:hypothetical protein